MGDWNWDSLYEGLYAEQYGDDYGDEFESAEEMACLLHSFGVLSILAEMPSEFHACAREHGWDAALEMARDLQTIRGLRESSCR